MSGDRLITEEALAEAGFTEEDVQRLCPGASPRTGHGGQRVWIREELEALLGPADDGR